VLIVGDYTTRIGDPSGRKVTRPMIDPEQIDRDAQRLATLHDELLAEGGFGERGFGARIEPYRADVAAGQPLGLTVTVLNPFAHEADVAVALVLPAGWQAERSSASATAAARGTVELRFDVEAAGEPVRRARIGVELTVDGVPFGQQAEALVDVT